MAITKEKAQRIAVEYAKTNFLNRERALLNVGYSPKYARAGTSAKLFSNALILSEIAKIQAKEEKKLDVTREKQLKRLKLAYDEAETSENPSAMVSAIREMNEMLGYHRDNAPNPEKEALRKRRTDTETARLRRLVRHRTGELAGESVEN